MLDLRISHRIKRINIFHFFIQIINKMPQTQSITIEFGVTEFHDDKQVYCPKYRYGRVGFLSAFNQSISTFTTPEPLYRIPPSGLTIPIQHERESDLLVRQSDLTMEYGQTFFALDVSDSRWMATQEFSSL